MRSQGLLRILTVCGAGLLLIAGTASGADIAAEGFEAPTTPGSLNGQNGGSGWTDAWFADGYYNPGTPDAQVEVRNVDPAGGSQHLHIYGTEGSHGYRHIPPQEGGVVYFSMEVKILNGTLTRDLNLYWSEGEPPDSIKRVHIEFRSGGDLRVRGSDVVVGQWNGTGALPNAGTQYVTVEILSDGLSKTFDLWYEGTYLGNWPWRDTVGLPIINSFGWFDGRSGSNDPAVGGPFIDDIYFGTAMPGAMSVLPPTAANSAAVEGQAAVPPAIEYTIANGLAAEHIYTVEEVVAESSDTGHDYPWLSVDPGQVTIPAGQSDQVYAHIDPSPGGTPLLAGTYTAWLKFSDNLPTPSKLWREITLTVTDWAVTPPAGQYRTAFTGIPVPPVEYAATNTGVDNLTYSVVELDENQLPADVAWLSLNTGGKELTPAESDTVTATIDPSALTEGTYTAYLKFTQPQAVETRRVTLTVPSAGFVVRVVEYKGDVVPTDPGSGGTWNGVPITFVLFDDSILQGSLATNTAPGQPAEGSQNGSVWHLPDVSGAKTKLCCDPEAAVEPGIGATTVARIKVIMPTSGGDSRYQAAIFILDEELSVGADYGGTDAYIGDRWRNTLESLPGGDAEWHIVRETAVGTDDENRVVTIYLDEDPVPVFQLVGASARNEAGGKNGVGFGAGSTAASIEYALDWLTGTNAGAFAPGEEVAYLGRSLIAKFCPEPFADADEDGDVDQEDFAEFQRCYTGAGTFSLSSTCKCFDRDIPGDNDVDEVDYAAFEACASGPDIPWTPSEGCP